MTQVELSEIFRNYAIVVGGVIGLGLAFWRGIAHNRQAQAQQDQAEIAQRAHITEVFKDAVEQLGNDKLEVRLGAVFTLKQIIYDFPEFDRVVTKLLTAYVRERSAGFGEDEEPTADIVEIIDFISHDRMED